MLVLACPELLFQPEPFSGFVEEDRYISEPEEGHIDYMSKRLYKASKRPTSNCVDDINPAWFYVYHTTIIPRFWYTR